MFTLFCAVFMTLGMTQTLVADLCAGCIMENGLGFIKHPTDCDKFVQCRSGTNGESVGDLRHCQFSYYWDENLLGCSPANETFCENDICKEQADGNIFGAEVNCRGYWECNDSKAVAMCCPFGQKYTNDHGCVADEEDECYDNCFNKKGEVLMCDKRPIIGKPDVFELNIHGSGWTEMPCPLLSAFDVDACLCTRAADLETGDGMCTPEIYLSFSENHLDESVNGYYVMNQNVMVQNGVAHFDGNGSRLIIPTFTTVDHGRTIIIRVKYRSKHTEISLAQAIVSNSDCGVIPSIMLSEDSDNIFYGIGTSEVRFRDIHISQNDIIPPAESLDKDIRYEFDSVHLTAKEGSWSNSVPAPGFLRNMQCALHIGYAENLQPFEGEIDELSVYLCNPDDPLL